MLNMSYKLKMHNFYDKWEHVNSSLQTFENESTNNINIKQIFKQIKLGIFS